MAKLALPSSQRLDFSDVGPWLESAALPLRERYVPTLPDEHWESDLNGHDAIAPHAGDLRSALASVERDLEAMRSTREQIASLLRGVDALVDGMEETAARCRSRLAPVHKLPPDLLALIFRWSIAGWHIYLTYGALPGALTHVCRRWRMVAHNCVDVHNMLQACPEVQVLELRLECIWLDGDDCMPSQEWMEREACIFERLESATVDTDVLARLRILKIVCEYPEHVVQDLALLRLVQRWATMQPPRLTDVEFWMTYEDHWEHKPPTADDVSRLRSLMDAIYASVPRTTRVSFFSEYSDAAEDTIISEKLQPGVLAYRGRRGYTGSS
ncbi:hypothetical protein EV121DRAFT_291182 [Schizophyllum commune]